METYLPIVSLLMSTLIRCRASVLPKHRVQKQQPLTLSLLVENQSDLLIPEDSPIRHCADATDNIVSIDRIDIHLERQVRLK